jgi:RNA polymerase sigma-70 factor (ECF subfamily)
LYYIELKQADIAKQLNLTTRTVQHDLAKAMVHCQWIQKHLIIFMNQHSQQVIT